VRVDPFVRSREEVSLVEPHRVLGCTHLGSLGLFDEQGSGTRKNLSGWERSRLKAPFGNSSASRTSILRRSVKGWRSFRGRTNSSAAARTRLTGRAQSESISFSMGVPSTNPQRAGRSTRQPEDSGSQPGLRVDTRAGVREEVVSFGPDGQRMFACTHLPLTKPTGGVVICSPLHAEFLHNYRKEVMLARSLATSGLAVQRFHYRGTGNSDSGTEDLTFESMLADTLAAVDFLGTRCEADGLAFLGTRLSALVASAAAKGFDRAPVALWEPVLDPEDYFREVFRAASIRDLKRELKNDVPTGQSNRASAHQLERNGSVDVLGYEVHRNLYRSFLARRFPDELGEKRRDVLLVQLDRKQELSGDYSNLQRTLQSKGFSVEARAIWANEHWWFSGNPSHSASTLRTVVGATAGWLNTRLRRG
jgi:hypothetical protein